MEAHFPSDHKVTDLWKISIDSIKERCNVSRISPHFQAQSFPKSFILKRCGVTERHLMCYNLCCIIVSLQVALMGLYLPESP